MWLPPDAPAPGTAGAAAESAAELAEMAAARLPLPDPVIRAKPARVQLVDLPTWLWVDRAGWTPRWATAAAPGVSVTATATPARVVWSMGDGTTLTCTTGGTPFPAGADPMAASPDCGHTYRSSSQDRPGGVFRVRATVLWAVSWAGAGQRGRVEDLSTSTTTVFRVV